MTHLVRKYILDSKDKSDEGDSLPVLYVQLPLPFSLRAMYLSIHEALGAPKMAYSTVERVKRRILLLLEARSVEMIIFDEAHHNGMSRNVSKSQALESLNHLSNVANIPLVLIGSEEIRGMLTFDMRFRLFRRFSVTELRRFELVEEDFIGFLRSIEAELNPFPVSLSDT